MSTFQPFTDGLDRSGQRGPDIARDWDYGALAKCGGGAEACSSNAGAGRIIGQTALVTSFTLDTNCIHAIEDGRPDARDIRELVARHAARTANVALVAVSASEMLRGGDRERNFAHFSARIARLGLGQLEIILPMAYWEVAFWDHALWADPQMEAFEKSIHDVLFPNAAFLLKDCEAAAPDPVEAKRKWINRKCDVQVIWSHIHAGRDILVTSDENFHKETKKPRLIALGAKQILYPIKAATLIARP